MFADQESEVLLREAAERELSRKVTEVNQAIQRSYREGNYDEVIAAIAALQPPLNAFFDSVMVMVEERVLRDNRLALLAREQSRWCDGRQIFLSWLRSSSASAVEQSASAPGFLHSRSTAGEFPLRNSFPLA